MTRLDKMNWSTKRKHLLYHYRRNNLDIDVSGFADVATGRHFTKALRHLHECLVRLEETPGDRIDKSDAAGHVGQDFFVEHHFALDAPGCFSFALIKLAAEPCENPGKYDQPGREDSHPSEKVMNGFVRYRFWLLHHRHPAGRFDRTERIEIAAPLKMPALVLTDLLDQDSALWRNSVWILLEITRKECGAILIKHFKKEVVAELNRGQTAPDSFRQNGNADVTENRPIWRPYRAHYIGHHPFIWQTRMNRRDKCFVRSVCLFPPKTRIPIFADQGRIVRYRCNQSAISSRDKHPVNPRMRIKPCIEPLLGKPLRIRRAEDFSDLWQRLIVVNDIVGPAEIIADNMHNQLNEGLPIAQDS